MRPTLPGNTQTAFLVDDDAAIRDALHWLFLSRNIPLRSWPNAEAFLDNYCESMSGCLILDIRMTGMTGVELFERLNALGCSMPTIFLTGHGDVPLAVRTLKQGAFDFIEKPFNDNVLVDRVAEALYIAKSRYQQDANQLDLQTRLLTLTDREQEVMQCVLAGKLNKIIADELNIAMRTVEVHRARLFEKMGVRSAVELAQRMAALKAGPLGSPQPFADESPCRV